MRPELLPWALLVPLVLLGAALVWAAPQEAPVDRRAKLAARAAELLAQVRKAGARATPAQRDAAREAVQRAGTPLVAGKTLTFVAHAPGAKQVRLAADFTGWADKPVPLERIPGTDLWTLTRTFLPKARIEYQLLIDGRWTLDPWNARRIDNGIGGHNSWAALPGYRAASPQPPRGAPRGHVGAEVRVGGHRVRVYLPAGYDPKRKEPYPLQVFQDGHEYLARTAAAGWLDQLIATKKIPPLVAVFVSPNDRMREYWADAGYVRYTAETLLPWVTRTCHVTRDRAGRGTLGDSLGGLISVHLAYARPELFGRVASQSGAFYSRGMGKHPPTKLLERVRAAKRHPDRLYMSVGRYEPTLLPQNRELKALLAKLPGAPTPVYHEEPEGHTWSFWRRDLPRALVALWGTPK